MTVENFNNKVSKVLTKRSPKAIEESKWREENFHWLEKSGDIALKVLETLNRKGWTQSRLAKALGVSNQQISKIVKGRENLKLSTIARLEEVLNTKLTYTFYEAQELIEFAESRAEIFQETSVLINKRIPLDEVIGKTYVFKSSPGKKYLGEISHSKAA